MRLTLVGADVEENLGMGMIAAAVTGAGHRVEVLGFNDGAQIPDLVQRIASSDPDVVGLAAQFQHRGLDFLTLATALRKNGFRGHITAGGHFASMGYASILAGRYGVDSVVLYDGEETIVDLLAALAAERSLAEVAGIAFRNARGAVVRTAPRCLPQNLDALPIAQRYRPHTRHMRIPFVPVSGSRGCWASCSFCSITTVLRDARAHGAHGRLLRLRSPEDVAAEMAILGRLGTPLHRKLAEAGKLSGSFLGWDYRLADDRAELLFRISSAAFRERNFASEGVANRYMGLNYSCGVLDWFYRVGDIRKERLRERAHELTKDISLDTAELLEQALDLAARLDPHDDDRVARETARLGLRVAASDGVWHAALDALMTDLRGFAATGRRRETVPRRPVGQVVRAAQGAAFAGWLALWAPGCNSNGMGLPTDGGRRDATPDYLIADMLPPPDASRPDRSPDYAVYDPLPPDAGRPDASPDYLIADMLPPPDAGRRDATPDYIMVDPLVPDAGRPDTTPDYMIADMLPPPDAGHSDATPDYLIADMLPPDASPRDTTPDRLIIIDPLPPDAGRPDTPMVTDPPVSASGVLSPARGDFSPVAAEVGDHWADTTPRRSARARDLPLCLPPEIRVEGEWVDGAVRVDLTGADGPLTIRWQSDGEAIGTDRQVIWTPASDQDQLNVAVRNRDGVAVAELRLGQVRGRRG
jgi:methylmalonyl-CoA mutase cobalamin-binding subunit